MISCLKKKLYRENGGHISDPVKYKKYKKDEKLRKWSAKKTKKNAQMTSSQPISENSSATNNSTPNSSSSFSCKHSIVVLQGLIYNCQKSLNEKAEVIQRPATKYKLKENWEGVVKS